MGREVGRLDGRDVGVDVGKNVGFLLGNGEGRAVGLKVGRAVGTPFRIVGVCVGLAVGLVGMRVGFADGRNVGAGAAATPWGEESANAKMTRSQRAFIFCGPSLLVDDEGSQSIRGSRIKVNNTRYPSHNARAVH